MRRRTWILSVPIPLGVLGLAALQQDIDVTLAGNGNGKGPKCKQELFCNPQQCEQLAEPSAVRVRPDSRLHAERAVA